MRTVLAIRCCLPPVGAIGINRAFTFAQHFPEFGCTHPTRPWSWWTRSRKAGLTPVPPVTGTAEPCSNIFVEARSTHIRRCRLRGVVPLDARRSRGGENAMGAVQPSSGTGVNCRLCGSPTRPLGHGVDVALFRCRRCRFVTGVPQNPVCPRSSG